MFSEKAAMSMLSARQIIRSFRKEFGFNFHTLRHIQKSLRDSSLVIDPAQVSSAFNALMTELQQQHPDSSHFRSANPPLVYFGSDPEADSRDLLLFNSDLLNTYSSPDIPLYTGEGFRFQGEELRLFVKMPANSFPFVYALHRHSLPSDLPPRGRAIALWGLHFLKLKNK